MIANNLAYIVVFKVKFLTKSALFNEFNIIYLAI